MSIFVSRYRRLLLLAVLLGAMPSFIVCVGLRIAYDPLFTNELYWKSILFTYDLLGPIHFVFDAVSDDYLILLGWHLSSPMYYRNWAVFTIVNIAFWVLIFGTSVFLVERFRAGRQPKYNRRTTGDGGSD